ncbi:MAG: response regulator [Halanaerobiales bacterium]
MCKVMIVDDSFVMRNNLRRLLEKSDYQVISEAENGRQAIMEYFKHKPDLVTMDLNMPVMGGIDAIKKIIEKDPSARIVIVSAFNQRTKIFEALENGAKHYIIKPITYQKVISIIKTVLGHHSREE